MSYFHTIHTREDFLSYAGNNQDVAQSFEELRQSRHWQGAASSWGIRQLFSCEGHYQPSLGTVL